MTRYLDQNHAFNFHYQVLWEFSVRLWQDRKGNDELTVSYSLSREIPQHDPIGSEPLQTSGAPLFASVGYFHYFLVP